MNYDNLSFFIICQLKIASINRRFLLNFFSGYNIQYCLGLYDNVFEPFSTDFILLNCKNSSKQITWFFLKFIFRYQLRAASFPWVSFLLKCQCWLVCIPHGTCSIYKHKINAKHKKILVYLNFAASLFFDRALISRWYSWSQGVWTNPISVFS